MITRYRHVVEIGAGDSHSSEGLRWSTHAEHVTLYEPHRLLWEDLNRAAAGMDNVTVHHSAISNSFANLIHLGYASFLRGNPSFLATSVEPEGIAYWEPLAREVASQKVDRVDYGTIDYLILTCGGAENDILPRLVSRPKRIDTKHYLHNARQHQEAQITFAWMARNGYKGRQTASNLHSTFAAVTWTLDSGGQPT